MKIFCDFEKSKNNRDWLNLGGIFFDHQRLVITDIIPYQLVHCPKLICFYQQQHAKFKIFRQDIENIKEKMAKNGQNCQK